MDENQVKNHEAEGNDSEADNREVEKYSPETPEAGGGDTETLGRRIARLRKERKMTQEQLAGLMGVTFQAVSKWENDLACPDVTTLPLLADIFEISIDALFGRTDGDGTSKVMFETKGNESVHSSQTPQQEGYICIPWEDDEKLRIVVFDGQKLLSVEKLTEQVRKIEIELEGGVKDIISYLSITCGDVDGHVTAGGDVTCGDISGNVATGSGDINCNDIGGDAATGSGDINCDDIGGDAATGSGDINCDDVGGDASAEGGDVNCGDVGGDVSAEGDVTCGDVDGDIHAGGSVYQD